MSRRIRYIAAAGVTAGLMATLVPAAQGATSPLDDAFYRYTGSVPLKKITPGTVLKTRTVAYAIRGLSVPIKTTQVLYRTRNQLNQPTVNVTTLIRPTATLAKTSKVLSFQSAYDSLNPADETSAVIASGQNVTSIATVESTLFSAQLQAGNVINLPDIEGQAADLGAGPESGYAVLDSLRAISSSDSGSGVSPTSKIGLLGYGSGGVASEWAAELAGRLAAAVSTRIVGTAVGGVVAHAGHTFHYVEGSSSWAGSLATTLVGLSRSFGVDLTPYLNSYGKTVLANLATSTVAAARSAYPGLTWAQIALPQYSKPEMVKPYVKAVNQLILGTEGTPRSPLFIGQGTGGTSEGTPVSTTYGNGDGVSIAGDARGLAKQYCAKGAVVKYEEYSTASAASAAPWLSSASAWLNARFDGTTAPNTCSSIAAGNSLAPLTLVL